MFHEVDPSVPRTIINKREEIPTAINGVYGHRSNCITMYQIKYRGNSMFLPNFIPLLWILTYQATMTYSIRILDERQAFNHFITVELLEIFEIEMPKSLMPNLTGAVSMSQ